MSQFQLTDSQLKALETILTTMIGASAGFGVQWLSTRKSKREKDDDSTQKISVAVKENAEASQANAEAAQFVMKMLRDMLDERQTYFDQEIQKVRISCSNTIDEFRASNTKIIAELEQKIVDLTREKEQMSHEIVKLNYEKKTQQGQIESLTIRLAKYDDDLTIERKAKNGDCADIPI
jgi:predicted  nucleic acid-binding Zn-ribbon protein